MFLSAHRWGVAAVLAAVLSLLLIASAKYCESRAARIVAGHAEDVAKGKATASEEEVYWQAEPLTRRAVILARIGLTFWITSFVCLGLSISRRERGLQNVTVVILALAALLQLLLV